MTWLRGLLGVAALVAVCLVAVEQGALDGGLVGVPNPRHPGRIAMPPDDASPQAVVTAYLLAEGAGDEATMRALWNNPNGGSGREPCLLGISDVRPELTIAPKGAEGWIDIVPGATVEGSAEGQVRYRMDYRSGWGPFGCPASALQDVLGDDDEVDLSFHLTRVGGDGPWRVTDYGRM